MNKKSGLADNPLFSNPGTAEGVNRSVTPQSVINESEGMERERAHTRTGERLNARVPVQANRRTPEPMNSRTGKRPISRQSYNVYDDQHVRLQRLEAESKLYGKPIHISDLVRQALDSYLKRYP